MHSMFYDHTEIKPEIKNRNIAGKSTNTWELNNTLSNKLWIK